METIALPAFAGVACESSTENEVQTSRVVWKIRVKLFQVVFHLRQSSYGASRGAAMEWMQSVWWSGHRAIGMPCQVTIGYAGRRTWDQPRLLTAGIADIIQMCAGVDNPRLISDIFQTRPTRRDYRIADTSFSVNVNSIFHLSLSFVAIARANRSQACGSRLCGAGGFFPSGLCRVRNVPRRTRGRQIGPVIRTVLRMLAPSTKQASTRARSSVERRCMMSF